MRRVTLMLAAMAMMVSLFAVMAYAADIQGTDNSEILNESERNDQIAGHRGNDRIDAAFYDLNQTPGGLGDTDKVKGNKGDDHIDAEDGDTLDTVKGGKGDDICVGDAGDELDCDHSIFP